MYFPLDCWVSASIPWAEDITRVSTGPERINKSSGNNQGPRRQTLGVGDRVLSSERVDRAGGEGNGMGMKVKLTLP